MHNKLGLELENKKKKRKKKRLWPFVFIYAFFTPLGPPSEPRNASASFVNESSAVLSWLPPAITRTQTKVWYDVNCLPSCKYDSDCEDKKCNSDVDRQLTAEGLKMTNFTALNLVPFVNYSCKITANNRVSKMPNAKLQTTGSKRTFTYVNFTTKGSGKLVEPDIFMGSLFVLLHYVIAVINN